MGESHLLKTGLVVSNTGEGPTYRLSNLAKQQNRSIQKNLAPRVHTQTICSGEFLVNPLLPVNLGNHKFSFLPASRKWLPTVGLPTLGTTIDFADGCNQWRTRLKKSISMVRSQNGMLTQRGPSKTNILLKAFWVSRRERAKQILKKRSERLEHARLRPNCWFHIHCTFSSTYD